MILLHAAPIVWGRIGGLHVSVPALVAALNRIDGVRAALVATQPNPGGPPPLEFPVFDRRIALAGPGRLDLPAPFDRPDLVIFNSTYIPAHATIATKLRKAGIPYIVCPRGGMTRQSQTYHRLRKMLANRLFFDKIVANAAALHYLTDGEAHESSNWDGPAFVIGNGTPLPVEEELSRPGGKQQLRLVFVGRLAIETKGLDLLLDACRTLRLEMQARNARLEIHGPDWRGDGKRLAEMIAASRLSDLVTLNGPILGAAKVELLRAADVFVQASRTEGHPMAVLEALAFGLPCLLTSGTNMQEVARAGAGWVVEPTAEDVTQGLRQVLDAEDAKLQEVGRQARRLAAHEFSWKCVAERTVEAYGRYAA